jgi:dipeptidyl aminopeptidase/acylaminoacyl peptidase
MKRLLIAASLVAAPALLVLALPAAAGSRSGESNRDVANGAGVRTGGGLQGPYRNGLIAFARLGNGEGLYVIRPDGTGERLIFRPRHDDTYLSPAWSPDGKWIAFVPGPPRKGLWMMRADGSKLHRITIGKGHPGAPSWSPNGKRIVFLDQQSPRSSYGDIFVVRTNGSGLERLTRTSLPEGAPAWGPYGEIVYGRGRDLWRMKADGSGKRLLARGVSNASWSPGGSRLAFTRGDPWTMKRDGTDAKVVADIEGDQIDVAWSPDGRWLVTGSVDRGDLMLVRTDGSEIHPLTHSADLYNAWPAWQRLPHTGR